MKRNLIPILAIIFMVAGCQTESKKTKQSPDIEYGIDGTVKNGTIVGCISSSTMRHSLCSSCSTSVVFACEIGDSC